MAGMVLYRMVRLLKKQWTMNHEPRTEVHLKATLATLKDLKHCNIERVVTVAAETG